MPRVDGPISILPTVSLDAAKELRLFVDSVWNIEGTTLPRSIDGLPVRFPHPPLQEKLMERQVELGIRFLGRLEKGRRAAIPWINHDSVTRFEESLQRAKYKRSAHHAAAGLNNPSAARWWRATSGKLQGALRENMELVLKAEVPLDRIEVGPRLLVLGRTWENTDLVLAIPPAAFKPDQLKDPLLVDEVRRRLRVWEGLRRRLDAANRAYPTEERDWLGRLNVRIGRRLQATNQALQTFQKRHLEVEPLKGNLVPLQRGITLTVNALEKGRKEIPMPLPHGRFTRDEGRFMLSRFVHHFRHPTALFLGMALYAGGRHHSLPVTAAYPLAAVASEVSLALAI